MCQVTFVEHSSNRAYRDAPEFNQSKWGVKTGDRQSNYITQHPWFMKQTGYTCTASFPVTSFSHHFFSPDLPSNENLVSDLVNGSTLVSFYTKHPPLRSKAIHNTSQNECIHLCHHFTWLERSIFSRHSWLFIRSCSARGVSDSRKIELLSCCVSKPKRAMLLRKNVINGWCWLAEAVADVTWNIDEKRMSQQRNFSEEVVKQKIWALTKEGDVTVSRPDLLTVP